MIHKWQDVCGAFIGVLVCAGRCGFGAALHLYYSQQGLLRYGYVLFHTASSSRIAHCLD
jgi:hypothetical protein